MQTSILGVEVIESSSNGLFSYQTQSRSIGKWANGFTSSPWGRVETVIIKAIESKTCRDADFFSLNPNPGRSPSRGAASHHLPGPGPGPCREGPDHQGHEVGRLGVPPELPPGKLLDADASGNRGALPAGQRGDAPRLPLMANQHAVAALPGARSPGSWNFLAPSIVLVSGIGMGLALVTANRRAVAGLPGARSAK
jgi:hypothetical protein